MCFNFCSCFFSGYSSRFCKFCNNNKNSVIAGGIKTHKSIIKKNKKKHDIIVLFAETKSNTIDALISKALIDSNISHDEFVLINNVLNEYDDMKEEIKNSNDK